MYYKHSNKIIFAHNKDVNIMPVFQNLSIIFDSAYNHVCWILLNSQSCWSNQIITLENDFLFCGNACYWLFRWSSLHYWIWTCYLGITFWNFLQSKQQIKMLAQPVHPVWQLFIELLSCYWACNSWLLPKTDFLFLQGNFIEY